MVYCSLYQSLDKYSLTHLYNGNVYPFTTSNQNLFHTGSRILKYTSWHRTVWIFCTLSYVRFRIYWARIYVDSRIWWRKLLPQLPAMRLCFLSFYICYCLLTECTTFGFHTGSRIWNRFLRMMLKVYLRFIWIFTLLLCLYKN